MKWRHDRTSDYGRNVTATVKEGAKQTFGIRSQRREEEKVLRVKILPRARKRYPALCIGALGEKLHRVLCKLHLPLLSLLLCNFISAIKETLISHLSQPKVYLSFISLWKFPTKGSFVGQCQNVEHFRSYSLFFAFIIKGVWKGRRGE